MQEMVELREILGDELFQTRLSSGGGCAQIIRGQRLPRKPSESGHWYALPLIFSPHSRASRAQWYVYGRIGAKNSRTESRTSTSSTESSSESSIDRGTSPHRSRSSVAVK